ncbi:hypothetical protein X777_07108 [Ooceraea biroi]|uniref:Uncharacterized protein n=1 Tax=Ooceraea biroi TaxID=2015173 RepID=A0A026W9E4_OOCBI|nr:hypothetical protein X777_07108 [Ooceraea biroi]
MNLDLYLGLAVRRRREHLALLRRYSRVAGNQSREHTAKCLDTYTEIEKIIYLLKIIQLQFVNQYAPLDRGTDGHSLVRIHRFRRLPAENFLHRLLHLGNPGHTADQQNFTDLRLRHFRIGKRFLTRLNGTFDQVIHETLEFASRQFKIQMFRPTGIHGEIRQIYVRLERTRQLDLRLLRSLF